MTFGKMLRLMIGSMGLRLVGAGLGFLTQFVLARSFLPADVGMIFLTMSIAAVTSMVAAVGYPQLALTQLPRFYSLGLPRLVSAFHGAFLRDLVVACALVYGVGLLTAQFAPIDSASRLAIAFGTLSAIPSAFVRYNSAIANSLRFYQLSFLPDFVVRPALFLGYVLIALGLGVGLSLPWVLAAYVGSNVVVTVLMGAIVWTKRLRLSDWVAAQPALSAALRKRSIALAIVSAVTVMFADIVTMIGGLLLPHDALAVLGLCVRLAGIAGFVIQSTQQFILPDLTEAVIKREDHLASRLLMRLNLLSLLTLAAGLVFVIALGGPLLGLFGETYRNGHLLLVLLLIGQSIRALSGMNQSLLSIGGKQVRTAGACIVGLVIFVASWMVLAPALGLLAAGVAVIIAEFCWALMLAAQAQSLLGRRGDLLWLLTRR